MTEDGQPIVYKSGRLATIVGMFLSACCAGMALTMPGPPAPLPRWFLLALACTVFVVSVCLLVMRGFTSIAISSKGIEIRHSRFVPGYFLEWSEIVEFFPERHRGRDYVVFTVSPTFEEKMRRKRYGGIHKVTLPDTYGFTAEALAKLLNAQRKSALAELHDQKAPG